MFEGLTGREREPLEPVDEAWAVIGRRAAKRAPWPSWRPTSPLFAIIATLWRLGNARVLPILSRVDVAGGQGVSIFCRAFSRACAGFLPW